MSIAPGTRLGPYEIVSRLGAGGMGEVFRARDTRLGRDVAVKVLAGEFSADPNLKLRFEREARTISQLNHPHICTLFDVGENYLVMELLEGETLGDALLRGALPFSDVSKYAIQVAEALDRAHRQGVVHRDLKPANVMLTRAGAKLLDFGLAKRRIIDVSMASDTEQRPLTESGMIYGTFQYMAPEQLEGQEADARSDIFALGALLYEMATGKRAFEGRSSSSVIAAIMTGQPIPINRLQPMASPSFERIVEKCLAKDPEERWQSAYDVAEALRLITNSSSGRIRQPKPRRERAWLLPFISVVALLAFGLATIALNRQPREITTLEAAIPLEGNGLDYFSGPPAFSPDGKAVVYSTRTMAGRSLVIRRLDTGAVTSLRGTDDASAPFWSPDGKMIAFFAQGRLKKISAGGGTVEVIALCDSVTGGGSWGIDGTILFNPARSGPIYRVAATGGEATAVTSNAAQKHHGHRAPHFLPDGRHFLFLALPLSSDPKVERGIFLASVEGKEKPKLIVRTITNAVFVHPGILFFVTNGVLRAQKFDEKRGELEGTPISIAPVQLFDSQGMAMYAASASGMLVYQKQGSIDVSELVVTDRRGVTMRTVSDRAYYWSPSISHDGSRVAVDKSDAKSGKGDIWIFDAADGASTRISFDARNETGPIWSADDRSVGFVRDERTGGSAAQKALGEGDTSVLFDLVGTTENPFDWSRDGQYVAFMRDGLPDTPNSDAGVYSLTGRAFIDIATSAADEGAPQFSPDGKWVIYHSDESGRYEIYTQPFPPNGAKYQVSTSGGMTPRWRHQNEIVYLSAEGRMTAVAVAASASFRTGSPEALFSFETRDPRRPQYDIFPDRNFLLNSVADRQVQPLTLLVNWKERFSELQ